MPYYTISVTPERRATCESCGFGTGLRTGAVKVYEQKGKRMALCDDCIEAIHVHHLEFDWSTLHEVTA